MSIMTKNQLVGVLEHRVGEYLPGLWKAPRFTLEALYRSVPAAPAQLEESRTHRLGTDVACGTCNDYLTAQTK